MDKFERYAISHYLSEWPEELTEEHPEEVNFDSIIDALKDDDYPWESNITVCETYELYEGEEVADMIIDMVDSLRMVFRE